MLDVCFVLPNNLVNVPNVQYMNKLAPQISVCSQTLTDWELIVCDSFSDDGTWEFLQQVDDVRVRLFQVPKAGVYAGWNECLKRVRGEYIYIASADDTMKTECLEKMVAALPQTFWRRPGEWSVPCFALSPFP